MARGKHAQLSANRRTAKAEERIENLERLLMESKARCHEYEADANRLQPTLARVAELEREIEEQDTPLRQRVKQLEDELLDLREQATERQKLTRRYMTRAIKAGKPQVSSAPVSFTMEEWEHLAMLMGEKSPAHLVGTLRDGSSSFLQDHSNFKHSMHLDAKHERRWQDPNVLLHYARQGIDAMLADFEADGEVSTTGQLEPTIEALTKLNTIVSSGTSSA